MFRIKTSFTVTFLCSVKLKKKIIIHLIVLFCKMNIIQENDALTNIILIHTSVLNMKGVHLVVQ